MADMPEGRCRGCGKLVQADHISGGQLGHTITESSHACGGNEELCYQLCPVPEAVSCGPILATPTTET